MEDPLLSHLLALAGLLALLLVVWTLGGARRSRSRGDGQLDLPPEVPGSWPVIGHLHLLRDPIPMHRIMASMADRYGPAFMFRLGVHSVVVISEHEAMRECFTTNDRVLASRPRSKAGIHLGYSYAAFGFAKYGPFSRKMKKLALHELLSPHRLEALQYVRVSEIDTLIRGLYYNSTVINGKTLNISLWLEHLALNVITRMIAGKRYFGLSSSDAEAAHVRRVMKEFMEVSGFPAISDLIPYTSWTDFWGTVKAMKRIGRELDEIVGSWVEEHKKKRTIDGERRKLDMNFIDVLISAIEDDDSILGYSRESIIKATVVVIIVAGSDTTSLNLTWVLSLLLNHKHSLQRAQQELDLKIGRQRWAQDSDINSLPYLQAIVKESLRLYPPGPLSVPHEADGDCTVNGYLIPKGTRMFFNLWKLHRDPRIWPDPDKFLPERFLTGGHAAGVDASGRYFEFIPFGSGRRACPGSALALQITHLALARLLQAFDMSTPENATVDMTEGLAINLAKRNPLEVLLAPRLPAKLFGELMVSS
ncbi:hypothetical protein SAY86_015685 [Trapa natans]|uniref:Uncharacterized protein n=1 Tax=Trapa natans TaxID=22666 RepID=A0AAN7LEM9_TRANT|nr:hypothetical protein SAY86_015685 [Trapa natans]